MQPMSFTCSRCGAPLPPGVIQCPNCGLAFQAPVPAGPAPLYGAPPTKSRGPSGVIIAILCAVGLFMILPIMAAILFPIFAQAREKARVISSRSNMKQLALSTLQYTQDWDETLPPMKTYGEYKAAIEPYLPKNSKIDYFTETGANVPYAQNASLSRASLANIQDSRTTVLLKETVPHGGNKINIVYLDGHSETVSPDETGND